MCRQKTVTRLPANSLASSGPSAMRRRSSLHEPRPSGAASGRTRADNAAFRRARSLVPVAPDHSYLYQSIKLALHPLPWAPGSNTSPGKELAELVPRSSHRPALARGHAWLQSPARARPPRSCRLTVAFSWLDSLPAVALRHCLCFTAVRGVTHARVIASPTMWSNSHSEYAVRLNRTFTTEPISHR